MLGGVADETVVCAAHAPTWFLAARDGHLVGFACHSLLLASLRKLKTMAYAYSIIGDARTFTIDD